jgi:hypothetical protein
MTEEPTPEMNPDPKVYDLEELGVDILDKDPLNNPRRKLKQILGLADNAQLREIQFKVPSQVAGLVRMVGDVQFSDAINEDPNARPAVEYFAVALGEPVEVVPNRVLDASRNPDTNYSHVLYVSTEKMAKFEPTIRLHPNYDPRTYPAVQVVCNNNQRDWTWGSLAPEDWTDKLK